LPLTKRDLLSLIKINLDKKDKSDKTDRTDRKDRKDKKDKNRKEDIKFKIQNKKSAFTPIIPMKQIIFIKIKIINAQTSI